MCDLFMKNFLENYRHFQLNLDAPFDSRVIGVVDEKCLCTHFKQKFVLWCCGQPNDRTGGEMLET